ncbi:dTMP kinase [Ructibacterium gallinarum]|uniref:Thymidylate kinase n=1 Tax=Ructibacterium gallinarum TaxID=2779355 RepID=A0A9D5LZC5_9FIRM|nr:dTMP kinase [Ructibacterium gallinarum]MBE5039291.1 dTMP kinase [Ructibacterium gallinarum]
MEKNKFIVIEGLDGCGKSTQIQRLAAALRTRGEKVHITAEPTNFETGAYLRRILAESQEKDMYLQAALFLADRLEHITHPESGIARYLKDGYTVICDRYYYSSFAYQGTASDIDWVMKINLDCAQMLTPDLCIFLDVNPATCKQRIDAVREKPELYEKSTSLMKNIRDNFLNVLGRLQKTQNIVIIDANKGLDDVEKEILKYV